MGSNPRIIFNIFIIYMPRLNSIKGGFGYSSLSASAQDEPEYLYSTMLFQQATAPTGWIKETNSSMDNCALTVTNKTSGLVKPSGTGSPFSASFSPVTSQSTNYTVSGTMGSTTVTTAMLPAHTHTMGGRDSPPGASTYFANFVQPNSSTTPQVFAPSYSGASISSGSSNSTGVPPGTSGHSHNISDITVPITIPGIDFSLKYVDAIMATRF
jgi:hypothetical protein